VSCDEGAVRTDENGIGPAELQDAGCHLRDLLVAVGAWAPAAG
jgi:hypothetical protein